MQNVAWEEMIFSFVLVQLLTSGKGPFQPAGGKSAFSWREALLGSATTEMGNWVLAALWCLQVVALTAAVLFSREGSPNLSLQRYTFCQNLIYAISLILNLLPKL